MLSINRQFSFEVHIARNAVGKRLNGGFGKFKERTVNHNCTCGIPVLYWTFERSLNKSVYDSDGTSLRGCMA